MIYFCCIVFQKGPTVSILVDYDPPTDFTPGPNEYRAASGPVTVTCTAAGAVNYQWSSTCRDCDFQSATSSSIIRPAVHSGDTGTHTCVATRGDGSTGTASIDFNVVGESDHLHRDVCSYATQMYIELILSQ